MSPIPSSGASRQRSRTGCQTCKNRKKKCDEAFDEQGLCCRCRQGGFNCLRARPSPRPELTAGDGAGEFDFTQELLGIERTLGTLDQSDRSTSTGERPSASDVSQTLSTAHTFPTDPMSSSAMERFFSHPQYMADAAFQAFIDTLSLPEPSPDFLAANFIAQVPTQSGEDVRQVPNAIPSLPQHTGGHSSGAWPANVTGERAESRNAVGEGDRDTDTRHLGHGKRPERWNQLSGHQFDLYNVIASSWFSSLPPMAREIVSARMCHVTASHNLTRAARNAVTSAYCAILRRSQKQARAIRTSYVGEGWLRWKVEEDTEMRTAGRVLNMDVPGEVLAGFQDEDDLDASGWEAKASDFFQQALGALDDPALDLETKLWAIMDMQLYQLARHGAAAVYPVLTLGEVLINNQLGNDPPLDFSAVPSFVYRMYAYADVCRTICKRGKKCVFSFVTPSTPTDGEDYLGLPTGLLLSLAAISDLAVEMRSLNQDVIDRRAGSIKTSLVEWRSSEARMDLVGSSRLCRVAVQEMWRNTAMIYLYQVIYSHSPLSSILRGCLAEIISLSQGLAPLTGFLACPWFIAATVAVTEGDREACRAGLRGCGPEKVWQDDLRAAEIIWTRMDEAGKAEDWRVVLEKERMPIAFF